MPFSKSFPKTLPGSTYPMWEEVFLTEAEERDMEEKCRRENKVLLDECLQEAKGLAIKNAINTEENMTQLAIALFEKRASHVIFWKEIKAKEKFDEKNR